MYGKSCSQGNDEALHDTGSPWLEHLGTGVVFTPTDLQVNDIGGYRKD